MPSCRRSRWTTAGVEVESEAFLRRYALRTDHDQDQVRAWQLFDPALIEWLTGEAPDDFSFELQNGALCGFVPGALAAADRLDALCEATARVHARVLEIGTAPPRARPAPAPGPGAARTWSSASSPSIRSQSRRAARGPPRFTSACR